METPQHGNGSKRRVNPSKTVFFWGISVISSNFSEISLNSNFEEFPLFFWSISQNCISVSPLFYSNILEGFPNIFEGIPNIFGPFPHFFDPFPLFSKTLKLICFLIFLIGFRKFWIRFSSYVWSVSPFFKKSLKISFCWSAFPQIRSVSSYFWSVSAFVLKL